MKQYIVITRPAQQASALAEGIKAAGGDVLLFPTIELQPLELNQENKAKIDHLNQYDVIIFISANAVNFGLAHILPDTNVPKDILLATIGQGTAKCLNRLLGRQPDIVPAENFNSEGLLATAALQNVVNKRILIFRGEGGREHLKETLQSRGAQVEYLNVYQRVTPTISTSDLEQNLQKNQIAAIVITSATSLHNLLSLTPEAVMAQLCQTPLVLLNKRLVGVAREAGFTSNLFVTKEASDAAMIETLKENNLLL